jgi:16S rRNA C967 or C1407 C5-methylase (RsmB/RsmF family)/NOL1/NOP2/fmu family ribosome biogenesis protein
MFPKDFINRIINQYYIDNENLIPALENPAPVSIRINNAKWNHTPADSSPVPWCNSGWYLEKRPSYTLDPLFHAGCYYPQEASSMFLEEIFNQVSGERKNLRVLDLCGAPGGKSTHLSSLIGENGFLITNEVIKPRAGILAENITRWGIGNTIVTNNDPVVFSNLKDYFNLILVDAPCSGEGMFSDLNARSEWSPENAALCTERQRRIVMDVWPSLMENGFLIYSTCTFNPAENEENIKWLSEQTDSESVKIDISKYTGIYEIVYKGIAGYGFYPGKIKGEGLFISVLRKSGATSKIIKQSFRKSDNQLTNRDVNIAEKLINQPLNNLYRNDDIVYNLALPVGEYQYLKTRLRITKGGTALYKSRNDDFTPLHDLALYCNLRFVAFPVIDIGYSQAVSFLRKESLTLKNAPAGWLLLKYMDINLGFVKNIGTRVNNYFPVDWRIRMQGIIDSDRILINWQKQV